MNKIGLWMVVLFCGVLQAQKPLDTIYANDKNIVALFFPEPVVQGITGASHFVFSYNREKQQYFGLLQAQRGEESNLLVVTDGGAVYSYILKYADTLSKLNYFISPEERIGEEVPISVDSMPKHKQLDSIERSLNYFKF